MVQDRDIWRAAGFLTREHGAAAKSEAARRADLMLFRGDLHGLLGVDADRAGDREAAGAPGRQAALGRDARIEPVSPHPASALGHAHISNDTQFSPSPPPGAERKYARRLLDPRLSALSGTAVSISVDARIKSGHDD